jgi:multiple sugar transport system permease protein
MRSLTKPRVARVPLTRLQRREAIEGYLWITPWIIGFLVFTLGPMLFSLYFSFTNYKIGDPIGDPSIWAGLDNYKRAFSEDQLFWPSLWRTIYFAMASVFLGVPLSLLAAVLLNQQLKGTALFRALFYLPSLTPVVAQAVIWGWLLQPQYGFINYMLTLLGGSPLPWLTSRTWVIPAIILISLWASVGGSRMIIFLAALQGVPQEMYEAAELDGAGPVSRLWNITIPMISPTILFNAIISIIGSFGVFSLAYIATDGGPNYGSWFYMMHLYQNAFQFFQMGYASALAWILFVLIMILTALQMWLSKRWVHYEYNEGGS